MPVAAPALNLSLFRRWSNCPFPAARGRTTSVWRRSTPLAVPPPQSPSAVTAYGIATVMKRRKEIDVLCLQGFLQDSKFPADIARFFASRMPYHHRSERRAILSRFRSPTTATFQFPIRATTWEADLKVGDDQCALSVHLDFGYSGLRHRFRKGLQRRGRTGDRRRLGATVYPGAAGAVIRAVINSTRYPAILARNFQRALRRPYALPSDQR